MGKVQRRLRDELTLFVRHMAWLGAVPKPPEGSRRAQSNMPVSTLSRLDRLKRDGIEPTMPPNHAPHIIARLTEIGLTESNGMGLSPLSWREIEAWQRATRVRLAPWEARLIRQLSIEYLGESRRAESENCPAPWRAEVTQRERDAEEANLRMVLG